MSSILCLCTVCRQSWSVPKNPTPEDRICPMCSHDNNPEAVEGTETETEAFDAPIIWNDIYIEAGASLAKEMVLATWSPTDKPENMSSEQILEELDSLLDMWVVLSKRAALRLRSMFREADDG